MKPNIFTAILAIGLLLLPQAHGQGPLAPSAAPAPTMKTRDQIEPRTPISGIITIVASIGISISADKVTLDLSGFTIGGNKLRCISLSNIQDNQVTGNSVAAAMAILCFGPEIDLSGALPDTAAGSHPLANFVVD
jgi:hypothetical protein